VRNKARYSLVLINESGTSRQLELSGVKLSLIVGAGIAGLVLCVVAAGSLLLGTGTKGGQHEEASQISALQEDLKKKDLALADQEKRIQDLQQVSTLAAVPSRSGVTTGSSAGPAQTSPSASDEGGPLTATREAESPDSDLATTPKAAGERSDNSGPVASLERTGPATAKFEPTESGSALTTEGQKESPSKTTVISFNAEDLTAEAESHNSGTLSFRLVKDQSDIMFAGYLFVFVEMVDKRGERKLWVYPKKTHVGNEDLPTDYRNGESVAFRLNSLVELSYNDVRSGATLAGVSVLLYGEDGRIVFQRGFDRNELRITSAKKAKMDASKPKTGEKRRAL